MNVTTEDKKLSLLLCNSSKAMKTFGPRRGRLLLQRVFALLSADSLEDMRNQPGHFHELTGDRKGQWACDLDQPYRLIFEPHEKPIPTDANGRYIWIEIKAVELTEITNYHGK